MANNSSSNNNNSSNNTTTNNNNNIELVEDKAWLRAMELASLCALPMAMKALLTLKVMDAIDEIGGAGAADRGASSGEIVSRISAKLEGKAEEKAKASADLERVLRLVASHGILEAAEVDDSDSDSDSSRGQIVPRRYKLNAVSQHFVSSVLAPLFLLHNDSAVMQSWHFLADAIADGRAEIGSTAFARAHSGHTLFTYSASHPRFNSALNSGMVAHSSLFFPILLDACPSDLFDRARVLVDVGGGHGSSLLAVVRRFPGIRAINFDLPHVVALAPPSPGIEHVAGDMFIQIPQADTILLKWILHDWDDEHCLQILSNCYKALPDGGRVIIIGAILSQGISNDLKAQVNYLIDVLMLAYSPIGKERTEKEIKGLAKLAGFTRLVIKALINEMVVIEIHKTSSSGS